MNSVNNLVPIDRVKVELVEAGWYTRWPCHACGGNTEKVSILAEVISGPHKGFRVCESCITDRNFDTSLLKFAERLESQAAATRSLIGRLDVPSEDEWQQFSLEHGIEYLRGHGYDNDAIKADLLGSLASGFAAGSYEKVSYKWLMNHGCTRDWIDQEIANRRIVNAKAKAQMNSDFSNEIPF